VPRSTGGDVRLMVFSRTLARCSREGHGFGRGANVDIAWAARWCGALPWSALSVGTQVAAVGSSDPVAGVRWRHRMAGAVGRGSMVTATEWLRVDGSCGYYRLAVFVTSQGRVWMSRDFGSNTFGRSGGRSRGRANVHGAIPPSGGATGACSA
jgi:hypothetical protein